jgi:cytidine deaminase
MIAHAMHHTDDDKTACGRKVRKLSEEQQDAMRDVPTCGSCRKVLKSFWSDKN